MTGALRTHESREIPLNLIDEPALPSRSGMDEDKLQELASSIRSNGLIQHLIVVPEGDRFEIIAGHRRYRASDMAGLVAVPCDIYPTREAADIAVQHAENKFREELSPADEAIWFSELLESKCGGDTNALAERLREKRTYVENRLNLLAGDREVFEALRIGAINVGVAQQLNRCDSESYRRMLLYQARTGGATVAAVSGWIQDYFNVHKPARPESEVGPGITPIGPVPQSNFFTCACCGSTDNVPAMQPVNIHTYCKQATFDPAMNFYNRRHEVTLYPRTLDEAVALVNELVERFPQLLEQDARRA